jgi:hypothetical protein
VQERNRPVVAMMGEGAFACSLQALRSFGYAVVLPVRWAGI